MEQRQSVVLRVQGSVARIALARPNVLNAFDHDQRVALTEAFERAEADPDARAVVLHGEGKSFCAGQDQRESAGFDENGAARRLETYEKLFATMRGMSKPIVAQLHGYAAGAGFQLALMCDLRIAGPSAKLGMTELKIGSPPIVGAAMLEPIIGHSRMRWMVLTADFVDARRALDWGLVHDVVDEDKLVETVDALAARLAAWDPGPVKRVRNWMQQMGDELFDTAWKHAKVSHAENFRSGSLSRGAKAFVARKR